MIHNYCLIVLFVLIILLILSIFNHNDIKKISYTLKGGFNENNPDLDKIVDNNSLSDKEKLKDLNVQLAALKQKHIDAEKIYNDLLSDINSKEDDINIAELDMNDAQNNLNLIKTSIQLKKSMISLKNNKDAKMTSLLEFNILLHKTRQYSIQAIISTNNTRKLRKNIAISPQDTFFKEQLMTTLETATTHAKQSRLKIDKLYKLCINSDSNDIKKHCDNLKFAKSNSQNLEDNIVKIQKHYTEKRKAQNELKLVATSIMNPSESIKVSETQPTPPPTQSTTPPPPTQPTPPPPTQPAPPPPPTQPASPPTQPAPPPPTQPAPPPPTQPAPPPSTTSN